MTSVGFRTRPDGERASCQDLHWHAWQRLAVPRPGTVAPAAPREMLLHGARGIGKTVFLRRLYWDLFDSQDLEVPILSVFPAAPFRPRAWARRFALESAQQWLAYARRDAALAGGGLLAPATLAQACRAARLAPLAAFVERFAANVDAGPFAVSDGAALLQAVHDELAQAAAEVGQRVAVLLDGAERATWREEGQTLHFTQAVRPLRDDGDAAEFLRRIWTWRHDPLRSHPLLPPAPAGTVPVALEPLSDAAAEEFFRTLAASLRLDYEMRVFADFLPLWGGVPRYLANFARAAADSPDRAILSSEACLRAYASDLLAGPTSQDLREALFPAGAAPLEPVLLARVAEERLRGGRDDEAATARAGVGAPGGSMPGADAPQRGLGTLARGGRAALSQPLVLSAEEREALARLAEAGLAVYDQGEWRAADVPVLRDALGLYVACHLHGERPERAATLLKRRHLVASADLRVGRDRERRLRDVALLLESFRGQEVPADLLCAHERPALVATAPVDALSGASGESGHDILSYFSDSDLASRRHSDAEVGGQAEGVRRAVAGGGLSGAAASATPPPSSVPRLRLPRSIGVFRDTPAAGRDAMASPTLPMALVAWCFEHEEHFRGEETLWIAHLCEAAVVTTEELEAVERNMKRLCRDLGMGRARGWLIAAGRFSPEAVERLRCADFYTSSGEDCMALGRLLLRGSAPRESGTPTETAPVQTAARAARLVEAPASVRPGEQVVELRLPPRAGMELTAARTIEEFAAVRGFGRQALDQMKAAVIEGCLNAIERSRNAEKEVRVRLSATGERLTVLIENEGEVFDPQRVETPRLEDKLQQAYKRGWGLRLMEKFMDRVVFEPYDLGTRLRMEKRIPTKSEQTAENAASASARDAERAAGS